MWVNLTGASEGEELLGSGLWRLHPDEVVCLIVHLCSLYYHM